MNLKHLVQVTLNDDQNLEMKAHKWHNGNSINEVNKKHIMPFKL